MKKLALALLGAGGLLCAGCAGTEHPLPAIGTPARAIAGRSSPAHGTAALTIRIHIPKAPHRGPHYISAATKGMTIAFSGPSSFTETAALTPGAPGCSGSPLSCTIVVALPVGGYTATIETYDQAPAGGAIPAGAGLLSTAKNVPLVVASGKPNVFGVTLDGVPASFVIGDFPDASSGGGFLNQSFAVTVRDAGGDTIAGTYSTPVTLTDTDVSGDTAVATSGSDNPPPGTLLSSGDAATLSYTGGAIAAVRIDASAGSASGYGIFGVHQPLYIAANADGAVDVQPVGCTNASCITYVNGSFNGPAGVAVDPYGNVFVSDAGVPTIVKIPAGCTTAKCLTYIGGGFNGPVGVAVGLLETVWVADTGNNAVDVIGPGCASASCVTHVATGAFKGPTGVALDAAGNAYVADEHHGAVKEIPASCSSASCVVTIGGGFTLPYAVAADILGNVYVADFGSSAVRKIPAGCTSAACVVTLGGGFSHPQGIAVDGFGNVDVSDTGHDEIEQIPPGCTASTCVTTLATGLTATIGIGTLAVSSL